jgi:hypothetical protein
MRDLGEAGKQEQSRQRRTRGSGRGQLEALMVCSDGRSCVRGRVTAFCSIEYKQKGSCDKRTVAAERESAAATWWWWW